MAAPVRPRHAQAPRRRAPTARRTTNPGPKGTPPLRRKWSRPTPLPHHAPPTPPLQHPHMGTHCPVPLPLGPRRLPQPRRRASLPPLQLARTAARPPPTGRHLQMHPLPPRLGAPLPAPRPLHRRTAWLARSPRAPPARPPRPTAEPPHPLLPPARPHRGPPARAPTLRRPLHPRHPSPALRLPTRRLPARRRLAATPTARLPRRTRLARGALGVTAPALTSASPPKTQALPTRRPPARGTRPRCPRSPAVPVAAANAGHRNPPGSPTQLQGSPLAVNR